MTKTVNVEEMARLDLSVKDILALAEANESNDIIFKPDIKVKNYN